MAAIEVGGEDRLCGLTDLPSTAQSSTVATLQQQLCSCWQVLARLFSGDGVLLLLFTGQSRSIQSVLQSSCSVAFDLLLHL